MKIKSNYKPYDKLKTESFYSRETAELINLITEDIPDGHFMDFHAHLLGANTDKTGNWINQSAISWMHPFDSMKINAFLRDYSLTDFDSCDHNYLEHFLQLVRGFPGGGKFLVMGLDMCYDKDGHLNLRDSRLHVSDEYIFKVSQQYSDVLIPAVSVHPYRKDALMELDKWSKHGVRVVKWIPGIMGMDASDKLCEPFYDKMLEHDMILLAHAGREDLMTVPKFQSLNNPLLFRKPLEMGVKVIMAHCATLGRSRDFENGGYSKNEILFYRLMDEEKYEGLLYGDLSSILLANRSMKTLEKLLSRTDLHGRLINGSDYPVNAIKKPISLNKLAKNGFLEEGDIIPLQEIRSNNPLLFDFAIKRRLRHPSTKQRLPASIFITNGKLLPKNMIMMLGETVT